MLAEPQRRFQPGAIAQIQHRPQLPLHGAAAQLWARAEAGRVVVQPQHHLPDADNVRAGRAARQEGVRAVRQGPVQVQEAAEPGLPVAARPHRRQPRFGHRVWPVGEQHARRRMRSTGEVTVALLSKTCCCILPRRCAPTHVRGNMIVERSLPRNDRLLLIRYSSWQMEVYYYNNIVWINNIIIAYLKYWENEVVYRLLSGFVC